MSAIWVTASAPPQFPVPASLSLVSFCGFRRRPMAPRLLVAFAPDGIFFIFGLRVPAALPIRIRLAKGLTAVLSRPGIGLIRACLRRVEPSERGQQHAPASSTRNSARNQATRLPFFSAPAESLCTVLPACTLICFASSVSFSSVSFSSSSVCSSRDACSECPRVSANALTVP